MQNSWASGKGQLPFSRLYLEITGVEIRAINAHVDYRYRHFLVYRFRQLAALVNVEPWNRSCSRGSGSIPYTSNEIQAHTTILIRESTLYTCSFFGTFLSNVDESRETITPLKSLRTNIEDCFAVPPLYEHPARRRAHRERQTFSNFTDADRTGMRDLISRLHYRG